MCQHYIRKIISTKIGWHKEIEGLADLKKWVYSHKFFQEHLVLCEAFEASPLEVLGSQGFKEHKQQQGKLF